MKTESEEDAALARLAEERQREIALPDSVWEAIEISRSPIGPLRQYRNLSQKELAEAAEISQSLLSMIESGEHQGDHPTLERIASVLRVGLGDVLPDEKN
ncbi:helix-turn-helix transcriptional regulator [Methyloligella sp. 2.7D]|uniref:helix-turn-helix transcriptional regulator n=1 Tax=unclassified Methyloligella TaxID=2625955 RepID=UPI00157D56A5|nr:helix-turn-helix transcriptional regulator [Methyloligella sp. GL2]QKP78454.1 helix-turn-helix transcriptional regulator [Methyloligella sp. GL2]